MRAEPKDDLLNICVMLFIRQLNDSKLVDPENVIVSLDIYCLDTFQSHCIQLYLMSLKLLSKKLIKNLNSRDNVTYP